MQTRRLTSWHVVAVALPTLGLLWLTFGAIQDQQDAMEVTRRANEDLKREQARTTREAEKRRLVEACFRDPLWTALPDAYRQLTRRHEVARHVFLWKDGSAVVPVSSSTPQRFSPETKLGAIELLELSGRDLGGAFDAYRRIASTVEDPATRALALHRAARTLLKLGRESEARAIWDRLGTELADQTDAFGRPYGLLAAFEPTAAERSEVSSRFEQFQDGRWRLTLEQQAFFLGRFAKILAPTLVEAAARRLREEEDLQKAIAFVVTTSRLLDPSAVRSRPIVLDGRAFELWSVQTSAGEFRGVAVNPDWAPAGMPPSETNAHAADFPAAGWFFGALAAFVAGSLVLAALLLAQASLREAQLGREKAESLVDLCHDVNNSLTAISVKVQALLQPEGLSREETDQACEVISERVGDLSGWIGGELKKFRAEAPLGAFRPILLHRPGVLFEHAARSFWNTWRSPGRELSIAIQEPFPPTPLDPQAVERALSNLLENACKYSTPGSTIFLRASATPRDVLVEVQNTGGIIPRKERRKIFRRYYRSNTAASPDGFGIGLDVVRQVMEAHGGQIEVESAPDTGTTFRLFFPSEVNHAEHTDRRG